MNDNIMKRAEIEREEKWREWTAKIPALKFKEGWLVKVMPPFAGAMARFAVSDGENSVSVYLDCHEALGFFGDFGEVTPYWEIHPYKDDVLRIAMADSDLLIDSIEIALNDMQED